MLNYFKRRNQEIAERLEAERKRVAEWDKRVNANQKRLWLEANPGKTEADYEARLSDSRHRFNEDNWARQRAKQEKEAVAAVGCFLVLFLLAFYYLFIPGVLALALTLLIPTLSFWTAFVASALIVFVVNLLK